LWLKPRMSKRSSHKTSLRQNDNDWPLWEQAIHEELNTHHMASTWTLEQVPPGTNIIGSKWVFKAKKDASGKVIHYKARLIVQGFNQVEGVDYFDTHVPVARLPSSHAVIVMASWLGLKLHQVNIKGAYLNSELTADEVLYMHHPPGYCEDSSGCVLRLHKSLYRLKQASQWWYQKFTQILSTLGFIDMPCISLPSEFVHLVCFPHFSRFPAVPCCLQVPCTFPHFSTFPCLSSASCTAFPRLVALLVAFLCFGQHPCTSTDVPRAPLCYPTDVRPFPLVFLLSPSFLVSLAPSLVYIACI
jgi:hypothetical protein